MGCVVVQWCVTVLLELSCTLSVLWSAPDAAIAMSNQLMADDYTT